MATTEPRPSRASEGTTLMPSPSRPVSAAPPVRRLAILVGMVLTLVVLTLPVGPATAEGYQMMLPDLHDDGSTTATYAQDGCFVDPLGDVDRGESRADGPQADMDLFCINYTADVLEVAIRIPQGTDPATDPMWDDFGAGIAYGYFAADGAQREIQLSTQNSDNRLRYLVLEGSGFGTPELICDGTATFQADRSYSAQVPASCIAGPEEIRLTAVARYGQSSGGQDPLLDFAPYDGGFLAVPRTLPEGGEQVSRFAGATRLETAIAASQASYADGAAGAVLVALADNFPDAVVAAPLAFARNAPVLLTPRTSVPDAVLAEARRALGGTGEVILLGGTAALSADVADAFRDEGHTVSRVSGDSRFTTAVAVARAANPAPRTIFLAGAGDFPDALVAAAAAPSFTGVAVLVDAAGAPAAVQGYLDDNPEAEVFVIGRTAAEAMPEVPSTNRIVGRNPGETSAFLARAYPLSVTEVAVATYETFPDGLAGGAYAASRGIPMLLSARDAVPAAVLDELAERAPLDQVTLFGGTAALGDTVAGQLASALR